MFGARRLFGFFELSQDIIAKNILDLVCSKTERYVRQSFRAGLCIESRKKTMNARIRLADVISASWDDTFFNTATPVEKSNLQNHIAQALFEAAVSLTYGLTSYKFTTMVACPLNDESADVPLSADHDFLQEKFFIYELPEKLFLTENLREVIKSVLANSQKTTHSELKFLMQREQLASSFLQFVPLEIREKVVGYVAPIEATSPAGAKLL